MKNVESKTYRMYGLVPYNISPIQQGIQYGHAVVEYLTLLKNILTRQTCKPNQHSR